MVTTARLRIMTTGRWLLILLITYLVCQQRSQNNRLRSGPEAVGSAVCSSAGEEEEETGGEYVQ